MLCPVEPLIDMIERTRCQRQSVRPRGSRQLSARTALPLDRRFRIRETRLRLCLFLAVEGLEGLVD